MWNSMSKRNKIIQVPIQEDLLGILDAVSRERGQSRAAFIREACAQYVASLREAELDRQYVEGYLKFPEDPAEGEAWIKNAAEVWGEESWEDLKGA